MTPRASVGRECRVRGTSSVVTGCIDLLGGHDADEALIVALGGPHARAVIDSGPAPVHAYWLRVWAARGLMYAWEDRAADAVLGALTDESWRVREMAAKVIAKQRIGDAIERLAGLRDDPVPRVRAAAERAIVALTAAGE